MTEEIRYMTTIVISGDGNERKIMQRKDENVSEKGTVSRKFSIHIFRIGCEM